MHFKKAHAEELSVPFFLIKLLVGFYLSRLLTLCANLKINEKSNLICLVIERLHRLCSKRKKAPNN